MVDQILSITLVDFAGKRKQNLVPFAGTVTLAQAQGYLTQYAPLLQAVDNATVERAEITIPLTLPTLTPPATNTTRINQNGLFSFRNTSRYKHDMYAPGLPDAAFTPDKSVDLTYAGMAAFVAAWTTGLTVSSVVIIPTNGSGELITALDHTKFSWLK